MVGPVWDQLPEGAFDLSPSRMLKARLARRVGVSGSSGPRVVRAGWGHAPWWARSRGACWSGGDLGQDGGAAPAGAAAWRALARVQDQPRGGAVPQVVQPHRRQAGVLDEVVELVGQVGQIADFVRMKIRRSPHIRLYRSPGSARPG
jgi:hypothetical protein